MKAYLDQFNETPPPSPADDSETKCQLEQNDFEAKNPAAFARKKMQTELNTRKPNQALEPTATACHGPCFLRSARQGYLVGYFSEPRLGTARATPPLWLSLRSLGYAESRHGTER